MPITGTGLLNMSAMIMPMGSYNYLACIESVQ